MPKEPLTKTVETGTKHGPDWRGGYAHHTYESKLTDRAKTKLRAQIAKAESIMRTESGDYGRERTKAYYQAKKMRDRALKLLGEKSSPGKKSPPKTGGKGSKIRERRPGILPELRDVEKKTRATAALVGVAKRANKE